MSLEIKKWVTFFINYAFENCIYLNEIFLSQGFCYVKWTSQGFSLAAWALNYFEILLSIVRTFILLPVLHCLYELKIPSVFVNGHTLYTIT